jgi:hypothetical protein
MVYTANNMDLLLDYVQKLNLSQLHFSESQSNYAVNDGFMLVYNCRNFEN